MGMGELRLTAQIPRNIVCLASSQPLPTIPISLTDGIQVQCSVRDHEDQLTTKSIGCIAPAIGQRDCEWGCHGQWELNYGRPPYLMGDLGP